MFRQFVGFLLALLIPLGQCVAQARVSKVEQLRTDGFAYPVDMQSIYVGKFGKARFSRDSNITSALVTEYMRAFSDRCGASLPTKKVEIIESQCAEYHWQERRGVEIAGTRQCVDSHNVRVGFADPEVKELSDALAQKLGRGRGLFDCR